MLEKYTLGGLQTQIRHRVTCRKRPLGSQRIQVWNLIRGLLNGRYESSYSRRMWLKMVGEKRRRLAVYRAVPCDPYRPASRVAIYRWMRW